MNLFGIFRKSLYSPPPVDVYRHPSLLRSFYWGRHATLLLTNGCSRERHIAFLLFLRTNRMHVIVIGYANQIPRYFCWAPPVRMFTFK